MNTANRQNNNHYQQVGQKWSTCIERHKKNIDRRHHQSAPTGNTFPCRIFVTCLVFAFSLSINACQNSVKIRTKAAIASHNGTGSTSDTSPVQPTATPTHSTSDNDETPQEPESPQEPETPQETIIEPSSYHDSKPRWVQRYEQNLPPRPLWTTWKNVMKAQAPDSAVSLIIATSGTTRYRIIKPKNAAMQDNRAAMECRLWLQLITGATFPIVTDDSPAEEYEILIGMTNRTPQDIADKFAALDRNGYLLATKDQKLFLLGKDKMGSLLPLYAFLEEDLGVRWYAPAPEHNFRNASWAALSEALQSENDWPLGTYRLTASPSLTISIPERSVNPAIPLRRLPWRASMNPWGIRNRLNFGYATYLGQVEYASDAAHTTFQLVPPAEYAQEHPEYYAKIRGQHPTESTGNNGGQLEYTNADTLRIACESAVAKLRVSNPNKKMFTLSDMDNGNFSEHAATVALISEYGAYSGVLLNFANSMVTKIDERLSTLNQPPLEDFTVLAYWNTNQPPTNFTNLNEKISVRFATAHEASFVWPFHSYADTKLAEHAKRFDDWQIISPKMKLWMYPTQYRHALAPNPFIRAVTDNIRYFAKKMVQDMYIQTPGSDLLRDEIRLWITAKLLMDPLLNEDDAHYYRRVEELFLDFILGGYYGDAGQLILEYHELLWNNTAKHADFQKRRNWIFSIHDEEYFYADDFIQKATTILDRALTISTSDKITQRIHSLKLATLYTESARLLMKAKSNSLTATEANGYGSMIDSLQFYRDEFQIEKVDFYDSISTIISFDDYLVELRRFAP